MKQKLIRALKQLSHGPLEPAVSLLWQLMTHLQRAALLAVWCLTGAPRPTAAQQKLVCDNVTFIFKSFERQAMARRLYRNIQSYYPGVRVVIADDSRRPLELAGPGLTVLQLPFNSGLSRGLNQALSRVTTPFTIRMDDDELLTPFTDFHGHLEYLLAHPEVDLVGVLPRNIPGSYDPRRAAAPYYRTSMAHAPRPLRIPHLTRMDERRVVVGKAPNIFIVRTDKYRALGYDDNIRMIDHQEFYFRAAGRIVSTLDEGCFILHEHNRFDGHYQKFRADVDGDRRYIHDKYTVPRGEKR
ncbi:MAG: glycosyltransferase [Oscillospiraceae bacterium]|nr:glycosyltransferase [Oscillospiraceae bacterium]